VSILIVENQFGREVVEKSDNQLVDGFNNQIVPWENENSYDHKDVIENQ
jgi:hypothetical protein